MSRPLPGTRPPSLRDYYCIRSSDLLDKCRRFYAAGQPLRDSGMVDALYRVTLDSGLDHRVRVRDSSGRQRELICFDSNSYLHLHRHPKVIDAVTRALDDVGYGTPSAQLLCGTNRYLRELEETIRAFHGREDTIVFSSGYAANLGTITALVRTRDLVVRDAFSHTSIHDGCRASASRLSKSYAHGDLRTLAQLLAEADANPTCQGKLIISDGVYSMHGKLAPLPELVQLARRHGATLMVDEAHATGVVGPEGRGTEDAFGLDGCADVLMGTFSKAPGTAGGYVTGSRELINYLRFYAHSAMFTAALPAMLCAGVTEAFRVMDSEPEHRERLWQHVRSLASALRQVGLATPETPQRAIVPVFVGDETLLWRLGQELFTEGVKAGIVGFPTVPRGESIIRLTVNALVNALLSAPRPAGGGKEPSYMVGAIGLGSSNDFHKPWISCAAPVPLKTNPARSGRRDVGVARFVDAGGAERQRHFLVSASLGITAEANGRFNQPSPSRSWLKRHATKAAIAQAALETVATCRNVPARLSLTEGSDPPMEARITNLAITKTSYVSGWLHFDTEVPPADGRFFACLCDGFDRRRTLSALLDLSRGRYLARHRRGSHQWRTPGLTVETPQPVALELDGEVFRASRVTFTVPPNQLRCCT